MDELAALVEKRAVVLIAFDDERISGGAEMAAGRRILRHAADQKTWIEAVRAQEKRSQGRGGRLAMRACDHDVPPMPQHRLVQQPGKRGVRQGAGVEEPLDFGVPARHCVANHHEVGREFFQARRVITF